MPHYEKRIDLEDRLEHAAELFNQDRYKRYLYCAFPFAVEQARRLCHMNGYLAEYGVDITGHGTDVYMAANEWCCCENAEWGVGLVMQDSSLVEFDRIHPDKTDYGNPGKGSGIYCYLANDWLQMHLTGGSYLDFRFRFIVTSYRAKERDLFRLAERVVEPVRVVRASGKGTPSTKCYLPEMESTRRLLTLKRAEDGNGLIARFYGDGSERFGAALSARRNTVDERNEEVGNGRFATYRLLETRRFTLRKPKNGYTGLITAPCAARGEEDGMLYLLWGQSEDPGLSHYQLYRSERADFEPSAENLIARVEPGEYRVAGYVDRGLCHHTPYYYRVCAVDQQGNTKEMSAVFRGVTKE